MSTKHLPTTPSWFRLPEYVKDLLTRVGILEVAPAADSRPYKLYTALLTQEGGAVPPTAVVLENTLGGTPVWSYVGVGTYLMTLAGTFTENKTPVFGTANGGQGDSMLIYKTFGTTDSINLSTHNSADNNADGLLYETAIEVRVYN